MTEAPDPYPDFPDDDAPESADEGVEGHLLGGDQEDAVVRTGDARVDAALAGLADLETLPVEGHAEVFERVHEQLRGALEPERPAQRESA